MYTIVLLTEDALTDHDSIRVAQLHGEEPVRVHVLVPVDTRHNRVVEALDELALGEFREALRDSGDAPPEKARAAATAELQRSLASLRELGLESDGRLVPDDPVDAVVAAAGELDADEVLVVTEPHLVETTFRRDWGSRLRSRLGHLPVLHFVAGTDRVY